MKKVMTAINNPKLNELLKNENYIEIIEKDIQYKEAIIEILEKNKNVDLIFISENLPGEIEEEELIKKIKIINNKIKIIYILEKENIDLEEKLKKEKIFDIYYNNKINLQELINIIKKTEINEQEEIKKEIELLKEMIINKNNNKENNKINKNIKQKSLINNYKDKILKNKINLENKEKIICIMGERGVGKSLISVNFANFFNQSKILLIDADIYNQNLHTFFGVKKYYKKINITENRINLYKQKIINLIKNKLIKIKKLNNKKYKINEIENYIVKINKKIDLISGLDILFNKNNKEKINNILDYIFLDLSKKYNLIIIDLGINNSNYINNKILKNVNKIILLIEPNLIGIKSGKKLINKIKKEFEIDEKNIEIIINKNNKFSIEEKIIKKIFSENNILGKIKLNNKNNLLINKNYKYNIINKINLNKEYKKIEEKIINNIS